VDSTGPAWSQDMDCYEYGLEIIKKLSGFNWPSMEPGYGML
jgi:hypothetical protein